MSTLGDGPIERAYREKMNRLAQLLDGVLNGDVRPKETGFVLLVFPFGDTEGRCNYISNAERADVVTMLKEQIARFEHRMGEEGTA